MAMYFVKGLAGSTRAPWSQVVTRFMAGAVIWLMVGCKAEPEPPEPPPPLQPLTEAQRQELNAFHQLGADQIQQLSACNKELLALTHKFLSRVSASALAKVQQQLAQCVSQHNLIRLLQPFSNEVQQEFNQLHRELHTKVTLPGYIDSLPNHPRSGIVNDLSLPLDRANLRAQQFLSGDQEVALGYGVLAQLLEQPLVRLKAIKPWPESIKTENSIDYSNQRRRQYLQLLLVMLVTDSGKLSELWQNQRLPEHLQPAQEWQGRQLQAFTASLSKKPVNLELAEKIHSWLEQGASPSFNPSDQHPQHLRMASLLQQLNFVSTSAASGKPLSP